MIQQTGFEITY